MRDLLPLQGGALGPQADALKHGLGSGNKVSLSKFFEVMALS